MSEKRDFYDVLGVEKNASAKVIKKEYHKLAKTHHPDKGGDEDTFKEITAAYEVLSDKDKRARYDQYGHNSGRGPTDADVEAMARDFERRFQSGFGNRSQQVERGQNLKLNVKLTLEEIFKGVTKKIKYSRASSCNPCEGNGGTGENQCKTCEGHGIVVKVMRHGNGMMHMQTMCPDCNGEGKTYTNTCKFCSGGGVVEKEEYVEVDVPHGIRNGDKLLLENMGHAVKGGVDGHLIVVITELPHKEFVRVGNDLRKKVALSYPDLVLGAKVDVPTIEGKKVRVTIPEYSKVDKNLRIQNKGMKLHGDELRGDMIIELGLDSPTEISDEEKELLEKLKNIDNSTEDSE